MDTRETIRSYFDHLKHKQGWESSLAEDMAYTNHASPPKSAAGRAAYLVATQRFYSTIASVEVKGLLVEGDRACALTRYELQPPKGPPFPCDVAEVFTVKDGKIASFDIYFDTAPFPK